MIKTDFLRQLDKFNLVIKKRVTSSFTGERRSEFTGSGLIFSDYANYSQGDDFKHIDWRLYAKTEKLYVKRYEEDRNLTVHIILDYSASMDFGTKIKKYEYASMIGLGFAYIALGNNEKFVLSTFDDKLDIFRPKKGGRQLGRILEYLNTKKPTGLTNFESSLVKYQSLINSRSLVIIISDFFYDLEQLRNVLYRYKKNKIKLIQVLDGIEKNMDIEGDYNLIDLESDARMKTFIDPYLRKKYYEKLEKHNNDIVNICTEVGADFYSVGTNEEIFDVFYRILR